MRKVLAGTALLVCVSMADDVVPEGFKRCYLRGYNDAVEEITSALADYIETIDALTDFRVRMIAGEVPAPRIRIVVEKVKKGEGVYEVRKRVRLDMGDEDLIRFVEMISGRKLLRDGYMVYVRTGEVKPELKGYLKKILEEKGYEVRVGLYGLEVGRYLTIERAFEERKKISELLEDYGDFEITVEEKIK